MPIHKGDVVIVEDDAGLNQAGRALVETVVAAVGGAKACGVAQ